MVLEPQLLLFSFENSTKCAVSKYKSRELRAALAEFLCLDYDVILSKFQRTNEAIGLIKREGGRESESKAADGQTPSRR